MKTTSVILLSFGAMVAATGYGGVAPADVPAASSPATISKPASANPDDCEDKDKKPMASIPAAAAGPVAPAPPMAPAVAPAPAAASAPVAASVPAAAAPAPVAPGMYIPSKAPSSAVVAIMNTPPASVAHPAPTMGANVPIMPPAPSAPAGMDKPSMVAVPAPNTMSTQVKPSSAYMAAAGVARPTQSAYMPGTMAQGANGTYGSMPKPVQAGAVSVTQGVGAATLLVAGAMAALLF